MKKIENSLIEAYENTNYHVFYDEEIIINIGKKNFMKMNNACMNI